MIDRKYKIGDELSYIVDDELVFKFRVESLPEGYLYVGVTTELGPKGVKAGFRVGEPAVILRHLVYYPNERLERVTTDRYNRDVLEEP